ncbi:imidazole glycerol phosphate synthase [Bacillus sp. 165]|uniref:imidazole glycerol phosphate synthase n=1 Tax=Bacillus sp. 165 TaxID=1529117 RepID=UPI001ADC0CD5|nr:imidazole glycerol phosphate synthase [Bacillus sp. 165]MBO9128368.1 imidazole glycerol phosphate synthase [Bacillus sp. 165]
MADRDYDRDFIEDNVDEEYAAEVAPSTFRQERREVEPTTAGAAIGWIALALAALSFFTYPVFFGIAAVVLGIYAISRDAKTTGWMALIIGGAAALLALFFRVALVSFFLSLF